jgi:hypothetical protein
MKKVQSWHFLKAKELFLYKKRLTKINIQEDRDFSVKGFWNRIVALFFY